MLAVSPRKETETEMADKIKTEIEAAIKAAEKSPVAAVNKLWLLLGSLDETRTKAQADLEKRAAKAEAQVADLEKLLQASQKLAGQLQEKLDAKPPQNLASAVKGYLRAMDNARSAKVIARCREQVDAILEQG